MSKPDRRASDSARSSSGIKARKSAYDPDRWTGRDGLPFRPTPAFFDLANPVIQSQRTLLGYDRLYVFWQAIQNVRTLPGAAAEVGTYRGGSAYFIASAFLAVTGSEVPLHVFDTFAGHPAQALSEHDKFHPAGKFRGTSYEDVRGYLSEFPQTTIHRGDVLELLPDLPDFPYRLVHLDTDLYRPTRECLDYFGRHLVGGGVLIVDDYSSRKCPGVPKAVGEYLDGTSAFHVWDLRTEQLILVKR